MPTQMYDEHARSQLPKLKRTYYQKCHALEVGRLFIHICHSCEVDAGD
jgi:hypothetical protein